MGILLALLLFSFIVIVHELGHFLLAKKKWNRCIRIFSWNGTEDPKL